jgi:hypothetical protein
MACRTLMVLLSVAVLTACGSSEQALTPDQVRLSTEDGGLTVRSDFLVDTCGDPERLEVMESSTVVEVRTVVRVERGDCDDIGFSAHDTASLNRPLGERQLVAVE